MKIKEKVILFFLNYLPLQIWTLKICNHDILKTLTARSFKLGQLIEDDTVKNQQNKFKYAPRIEPNNYKYVSYFRPVAI